MGRGDGDGDGGRAQLYPPAPGHQLTEGSQNCPLPGPVDDGDAGEVWPGASHALHDAAQGPEGHALVGLVVEGDNAGTRVQPVPSRRPLTIVPLWDRRRGAQGHCQTQEGGRRPGLLVAHEGGGVLDGQRLGRDAEPVGAKQPPRVLSTPPPPPNRHTESVRGDVTRAMRRRLVSSASVPSRNSTPSSLRAKRVCSSAAGQTIVCIRLDFALVRVDEEMGRASK